MANAEQEFRAALDEPEALKQNMPPDIGQSIRKTLSVVLANTGRRLEAVTIAKPITPTEHSQRGRRTQQ